MSWCDELNQSQWNEQQIVRFFHCLPVTNEVWRRIEQLTPEIQTAYWEKIFLRPFFDDECDVNYAVQRLLDVGRPFAALACLDRRVLQNKAIDTALTIKVLHAAVHSSESPQALDIKMVLDLIQMLQNTGGCDDDLLQLEWAYLPAFSHRSELSPKTLQNRLANDPEFFCQLIQMMFRSQKEESNIGEPAKDQEQIASQAYQLLEKWPITPGMQTDDSFNKNIFTSWLKKVKESCQESGHLEIALIKIGNMLVTAPADPKGLWLDRTIADALNEMDNGPMRSGFENGLYNSRGAHLVYPSGEPEVELAKNYRGKAEDIENAGFPRLATTLRILADNYDTQAKRIIDEHKIEHKQ